MIDHLYVSFPEKHFGCTEETNMNRNNSEKVNSVFYAKTYHPIQAGSIDGTDILPHDNAVYRALLCSSANLYDQFGDVKVIGGEEGGYSTVFVGRLNRSTNEDTLREAMSKYGTVKNLRLIRHIVTGASQGYAFVEYESEREMRRAYEKAHRSIIDDSEVIVDYNRQQLMPGWIPRRLGGGLGGKKESGQLRFGGRERPFRAPLRPIPYDDLKRLGIPPPPEGNYMSRFEVPSPPRRKTCDTVGEDEHSSRSSRRRDRRSGSRDHLYEERESMETEDGSRKSRRHSRYFSDEHDRRSKSRDRQYDEREDSSRKSRDSRRRDRRSKSRDHQYDERKDSSRKSRDSHRDDRRSKSRDRQYDEREDSSRKSRDSRRHDRRSNSRDPQYDEREDSSRKSRDSRRHDRTSKSRDHLSERRDSSDREEHSHKRHRRE